MELYVGVIKKWLSHSFRELQDILYISIIFVVLCLPVISIGIALSVCFILAKLSIDGYKIGKIEFIKNYVKPILFKSFIVGFIDLIFAVTTVLCCYMLISPYTPYALAVMYMFFLGFDILFFMSAMYRYPILVCNEDLPIKEIYTKSLILVCKNLMFCIAMLMVLITVLGLSLLTGIGVLFIFPGAAIFLISFMYKQMIIINSQKGAGDDGD